MPLYYFECKTCKREQRKICSPEEVKSSAPECCGAPMRRKPKGASTRVVERLDNGLMTKGLERLADAERLFHERAESTRKKARGE